jgi:hypothetical protein
MTNEAMSPLRRRMIEDVTIRKLAPKTQHDYAIPRASRTCAATSCIWRGAALMYRPSRAPQSLASSTVGQGSRVGGVEAPWQPAGLFVAASFNA